MTGEREIAAPMTGADAYTPTTEPRLVEDGYLGDVFGNFDGNVK